MLSRFLYTCTTTRGVAAAAVDPAAVESSGGVSIALQFVCILSGAEARADPGIFDGGSSTISGVSMSARRRFVPAIFPALLQCGDGIICVCFVEPVGIVCCLERLVFASLGELSSGRWEGVFASFFLRILDGDIVDLMFTSKLWRAFRGVRVLDVIVKDLVWKVQWLFLSALSRRGQ